MSYYKPEELMPRLSPMNEESRAAIAYLFSECARAASTLNVLSDANHLASVENDDYDSLPPSVSEGLVPEDLPRIREISFDPDEFEFLVSLYEDIYPQYEHPLAQARQALHDEVVEDAVSGIQDEILSDREASSVVMELALRIAQRFDRDQQSVADDIVASFTYSDGLSPEDYADGVPNRNDI